MENQHAIDKVMTQKVQSQSKFEIKLKGELFCI